MHHKKDKILIIDDNEEFLIGMKLFLSSYFTQIDTTTNPQLIPRLIKKENYQLVLLDMNFSAGINTGNEGLFWMKEIHKINPSTAVVLITAYGEIELAVEAMKQGATDFIQKGQDEEHILKVIINAFEKTSFRRKKEDISSYSEAQNENHEKIYGDSAGIQEIRKLIDKVAYTDANILILGENGTGKELIAKEIHRKSSRGNKEMIMADLASIPETICESELFGHVKGAYTDAKENRIGRFELASGSTLFLDEVGNIPLLIQAKILTALENRSIIRVGSNKPVPVDIRLISATNMPLNQLVEEGKFRKDLLYRINTIQINVPPLRERTEDIELLVHHFLSVYRKKYNKNNLEIDKYAITKLKQYYWPGNIRELRHFIEKAVILSDGEKIDASVLCFDTQLQQLNETQSFDLELNEKILIQKAINRFNGNLSETAKNLGITRSTLYKKIDKYGL